MKEPSKATSVGLEQRLLAALVVLLALAVVGFTWVGIRESRSDSLRLLILQGRAFTEALAQAAENAIASESIFDHLVYLRYSEVVRSLPSTDLSQLTDLDLVQLAVSHDLYGAYIFDSSAAVAVGGTARGPQIGPPEFVADEVAQLLANPEDRYTLLLDEGDHGIGPVHYYLEITGDLSRVVLLVADALYFTDALRQTQIGYLARNMAGETGVEYIIYQSTDGIVFASRKMGSLLAIESDPFLVKALESDTIMHRLYRFQEREVLELARPFSSVEYPFGVLRVGLSLEGYYSISSGFDVLMISLAAVLFVLLLVALLYLSSRRKRREISRKYARIKTVTDRIFDEMRTGVAAVQTDGAITLANDAFEGIFGVSGCVGRHWDEVTKEPQLAFGTIHGDHPTSLEKEVSLTVDDVSRTLLVAASPLEPEEGQPSGVVAVVYDITRLRKFERESARKERLSEMGNLAAGVAHEIRNPLNTISIAVQRLAGEFEPIENRTDYEAITTQIKDETKRLNDIITRFLALARGEKQRYRRIRLDELITEVGRFFEPEARQLGIELSVRTDSDLTIEADLDSLKQVFSNLFNNAKEALAGKGGGIVIAAKRRQKSVEILFADTGPGIPAGIREKMFTPYFTTKDGGTGLGLPTVHKIITDLGGEINVRETESGGAAFVISLPRPDRH
ncbi:MAG: PAS domain S-box protein [candidate division Zixibacteria bacterium]|nr:PAS domain S-box protein [candidate division Zixibacteria bacterium]